jgi:hypothetical protein
VRSEARTEGKMATRHLSKKAVETDLLLSKMGYRGEVDGGEI